MGREFVLVCMCACVGVWNALDEQKIEFHSHFHQQQKIKFHTRVRNIFCCRLFQCDIWDCSNGIALCCVVSWMKTCEYFPICTSHSLFIVFNINWHKVFAPATNCGPHSYLAQRHNAIEQQWQQLTTDKCYWLYLLWLLFSFYIWYHSTTVLYIYRIQTQTVLCCSHEMWYILWVASNGHSLSLSLCVRLCRWQTEYVRILYLYLCNRYNKHAIVEFVCVHDRILPEFQTHFLSISVSVKYFIYF